MRKTAFERILLRDDYLLYREERAGIQWVAKTETLLGLMKTASERLTATKDKALLQEAQKNFDATFSGFSAILEKDKRKERRADRKLAFDEAELRLIGQVFLKAYALQDSIGEMHESIEMTGKTARNRGYFLIVVFVLGGGITIVINSFLSGRFTTKRLQTLHEGIQIIGGGDLGYRIAVEGNNELADLASESNQMAASLEESFTSIDNLNREITERKQAEEQIHRQSQLLAAINRIFLETLTAESEEAVATTCLKVAQEITDSKFGFIGEITPEGLFTTTALSDPGQDACRIPETHANLLIKDMVIRGIWGQVILKDQSLIVNDPVSYPDRVGIPEGHPPLTSFLGVPLEDQGKVIGMIAVANRVSGYTVDNQQDMEALSVAFVEAINRQKAEEKIRNLNAELEQRVIDRTTQLESTNKELESFSYSVSHDLRAPLRSIDGFSQALLEEYGNKLEDTGKTYLERIRKATRRMGILIDDMLKLSRVTRTAFRHEPVDLSQMIRTIAKANQQNNPDRAVEVIIQEGITVQGDPYLMQIVLVNLLDNAWKFTSRTAHPRIEFGKTIKGGETIYFIRDNGVGFDMTYVGKLFGAFQRLHTSHEFTGTGIGLATVQRIIYRHGGRVWAEGEIGKGATFYFTLP